MKIEAWRERRVEQARVRQREREVARWVVLIYKSVSDVNVTMVQPSYINFRGRTTFTWSNFFIVRFAHTKKCYFYFLCFLLCFSLKYKEIKRNVFDACKTNGKKI